MKPRSVWGNLRYIEWRPVMPWGQEQDKLTQEARLFLASPEIVFQELKKLGAGTKADLRGRNGWLDAVLAKRNDPLINLGLASEPLLLVPLKQQGPFATALPPGDYREACERFLAFEVMLAQHEPANFIGDYNGTIH